MLIVLRRGDNFLEVFKEKLAAHGVKSGFFYGLGGFSRAELSFYDLKRKKYLKRKFRRPLEVLSLIGNIAQSDDGLFVHAHAVLSKNDFKTIGGHLVGAVVSGTLEIFITPAEEVHRKFDENTGLELL